ncbi:MAG: ABC transporter substrate-binding protein [Desulfomonilaceae bacterium]
MMRQSAAAWTWVTTMALVCLLTMGVFNEQIWAFNEAPMLAKMVKEGALPSVDKRLPETPPVIKPVDKPGSYGGTWRRAYLGLSDLVGARRVVYDPLVRWSPEIKIEPNLALKWDIDPEGRIFTFHLVRGVKWSDGAPFTADDILFYFEDILFDKELTPSIPMWLAPSGNPPKVSKTDDYTFRIEFDQPYGLFLERLACPDAMALVTKPKHYLKKFHKKYAKPEELEAIVKERNATSWVKLFQDVSDLSRSQFVEKGLPSICAWVTTLPAPAKRFVMERNPYYWKVDPQGNQLPYIDTVVHDLQAESQTIVLKAIAGEIDMQGRNLGGMQNSVLLLASVGQGKYKLVPKTSTASVGLVVCPNLNCKDPVMQKILADRRFRIALSHAINRKELNKIVYRGRGIPRQAAPLPQSEFYSESYEKAYLMHDPAKAAALLDEMGLTTNKAGNRLRPDGQELRLTLDVMVSIQSWVDTAEILASNFKSIGIDTEVKSETRELFRQRTQGAAHEIALWTGDGGMECLLDPRWYFPYGTESLNAPLYGQWCQSEGKKGEEPPQDIKELIEIYHKILRTVSPDEKKKLFSEIIAANEKNLWVIGLVHDPPDYYVVAPNMFNVPKKDFQSWIYPNPGPINPEQFSFEPKK